MNNLVTELPADGQQKEPSSDVVVNICGTLNNLVTSSSIAARDIAFFDGLQKLVAIKNSHDSRYGMGGILVAVFLLVFNLLFNRNWWPLRTPMTAGIWKMSRNVVTKDFTDHVI